jgi:hypothetical protein
MLLIVRLDRMKGSLKADTKKYALQQVLNIYNEESI